MMIPYRTQRVLKRIGYVIALLLLAGVLAWFCSVIFLERYVVYSRNGASLDFSVSAQDLRGEVALPPVGDANVAIYYNEGNNAVDAGTELTQLNGYYIDTKMLQNDMDNIWPQLEPLASGTPIMIELKAGYGSFYYSSNLGDAVLSESVSHTAVDELIKQMHIKGFYTIAKVSAFRDYNYGNNHVLCGLPQKGKQYLWPDEGGSYWLNPTNEVVLGWLVSMVNELKSMGFNEVLLADFRFPNTDMIAFGGDKEEAITSAAQYILDSCTEETFTVSFGVATPSFALPDGRTRMYLSDVDAKEVSAQLSKIQIDDPTIRLVFIAETNDTRFDKCGVLRPLYAAEVLEAQKADLKAEQELEEKMNPSVTKPNEETKPAEKPTVPTEAEAPVG